MGQWAKTRLALWQSGSLPSILLFAQCSKWDSQRVECHAMHSIDIPQTPYPRLPEPDDDDPTANAARAEMEHEVGGRSTRESATQPICAACSCRASAAGGL
ncbi:hypothetical protein CDEST_03167 [Colletotrichum destructivum]|uniref:Secreted protein n=1 Tax=Colletotrichum destructivum TaxID=34406 RepID=A0AAX4I429_9PEZI|nr:hypothetical protein CDEST_03167 [Colletotrichum destructivum]